MDVQVSAWGVILAMVSSMVVGAIWYSPQVFAKRWAKLAKVDMSGDRKMALKPLLLTALVSLITAYVLAHVTYLSNQFFHHSYMADALGTAFWVWLGFTAARFITHDAFEGRPAQLTLINIAHEFVTLMVMGLVLGLVGI